MSEPVRSERQTHQCCCRLRYVEGYVYNICVAQILGPDQPICTPCEKAGHPRFANFDPAIPSVLTERSNQ